MARGPVHRRSELPGEQEWRLEEAADLSDCLQEMPDGARYQAVPVDKRIYDPDTALRTGN